MPSTAPQLTPPVADRSAAAGALLAMLMALATRLPFLPQQLHDHDSVNFAHALQHFDLSRHSPHLPGYPLYVLLGRLAQALGAESAAALAWPAAVGAMAAAAALAWWLAKTAGPLWALAGVALYLSLPDLWLADARPLSDGLGAHLVTATAVLALASVSAGPQTLWLGRGAVLAAAALLAVRLSSWPVALGILLWMVTASTSRQERWTRLGLFAAVTLAWLLPLAWLAGGPLPLWKLGAAFAQGHATQWRGDGPPLQTLEAAQLWLAHLWDGGAGLLAVALLMARLAWPAALQDRPPVAWLLALAMGYLAWMVLGQNPERSRHILPLVALLAVALLAVAGGRTHGRRRSIPLALSVLAVGAAAAVSVPRLHLQQSHPSPDVALGSWLARQPAEGMLVLGGSEVGVVRWQAPAVRSLRVASAADLRSMLGDPSARAPQLYASSRVPGLAAAQTAGLQLTAVATFAARPGVDLAQQTLTLYRLQLPMGLALSPSRGEEHP